MTKTVQLSMYRHVRYFSGQKVSPMSGHIEPTRMAKPPRVRMGSVVNGHAPAYGVWWLYTHLEWGTWGTAAFFFLFF